MRIFIDIETQPTPKVDAQTAILAAIRPPSTYKKPESIALWQATEGVKAGEEAIARTALAGELGEIIAIGMARDDDLEPLVLVRELGEREDDLLLRWFDVVNVWLGESGLTDPEGRPLWEDSPYFIAHNALFDLGFLWKRCAILGLRSPFVIPAPTARLGKSYGCTMMTWAGFRDRISLQALCLALGLPDPKADGGGRQAYEWWRGGDHDRVTKYCAGDVAAVRAIWHRLTPMFGGNSE